MTTVHPRAPLLDVAAIDQDVAIDVDMRAFDGTRRRRRSVLLFAVFIIIVFGGLFAMLALSYSHAHN